MRVTSEDILQGPTGRTLMRMTWPVIVSIFFLMLFGAVDTFYISLLGTEQLAAISFTFPVTFFVVNITIGLSVATSIMLARLIGSGQRDQARRSATDSLLFSLLPTAVIAIIGILTIDLLFGALGATNVTLPYIHEYMVIWYAFVLFLVTPMISNGAIRASGDTKWPALLMLISGVTNAILDPLLIFGIGPFPRLEVAGAAYATAASWMVSFVISIWILRVREQLLTFEPPSKEKLLATWKSLIKIGSPIAAANVLTPIVTGVLVAIAAQYGETTVAAMGIGSRIEAFAFILTLATTSTLSTYLAQNFGASQYKRAYKTLRKTALFVVAVQLILAVLIGLFSVHLAGIFTSEPEVLEAAKRYLWIMPFGLCFQSILLLCNTAFNAGQHSFYSFTCSLLRFVFISICAWLLSISWGLPGVFAGAILGNVLAAALAMIILKSRWHRIAEG